MLLKEKNLFVGLCIGTIISFILCGYSLISCFVFSDETGLGSHILEISYLFLHLILCAIVFYLAFRAIRFGSFFIKNVVYDENGKVYKSKKVGFIITSIVFLVIFIYSMIQAFTMSLPLATELGKVVWHDLMNGFFLLTVIFTLFVLYTFVPYNRDNKKFE